MSRLTQWHLDNWTDADFKAHTPAVRNTIALLERDLAEARADVERINRFAQTYKRHKEAAEAERDRLAAEVEKSQTAWLKLDDVANEWADRAHTAEAEVKRLTAELAEERAKPKLKIKRVERQPLVIDEPPARALRASGEQP